MMSNNKEMELLSEFITNNLELESLNAKLNEFNPFNILKISEFEIRHSNVLAWLLDPAENHNLGDKVFKSIVCDILLTKAVENISISAAQVKLSDYSDCEIRREWKHIDIFAISRKNKFILLIENKVNAKEGKNQLERYEKVVQDEYGEGYQVLYVYLTKDGDLPSCNKYTAVSYEDIYKSLNYTIELYKEALNSKVLDFITYYVNILEVLTMENREIIDTCKHIYSKYKEALDLIYDYGVTSSYDNIIDEFISNNEVVETRRPKNELWFIPNSYVNKVPKIISKWKSEYCFSYFFQFDKNNSKINLYAEIAPFEDNDLRLKLLKFLKQKGYGIKESHISKMPMYIKIYSSSTTYKESFNDETDEDILKSMTKLYNTAKMKNSKLLEDLQEFNWEGNLKV